jgi:hypothetical protein
MTKKNFSLIFSLAIAVLVFGCAMPAAASNGGKDKGFAKKAPIVKSACVKFNNLSDTIGQRMINGEAKLERIKASSSLNLAERQGKWDKFLAASRANWNVKGDKQFSKLERRASTTAEKEAVAAFKATMTAAVAVRQAAVDKAIADYRAGLKDKMAARQAALNAAITAYKNAADAAFAKAKLDCASSTNFKIVNNALKASLKAAQDKFKADRQAVEKLGPDVKALTAAKKTAIDKAISNFKTAADNAKAALKAAFGIVK